MSLSLLSNDKPCTLDNISADNTWNFVILRDVAVLYINLGFAFWRLKQYSLGQ